MTDRKELIQEIKEKQDRISELELNEASLEDTIEDLEEEISNLKNELGDANRELEDWEDHECECDCSEEISEAIAESIPNKSIEDQRKIDLLAANWHSLPYDKLYQLLSDNIPNMLPPRI